MKTALLWGLVNVLAVGCVDDKGVPNNGKNEKKPTSSNDGLKASDDTAKPVTKVADASYDITVTSRSGANLCLGTASIEITSDFSMKFPAASISCVSLTIDLAKILGATQATNANTKITSDGKMIYMDKFGTASFEPARPFLVGPIIQDPTEFEGYTKDGDYAVTFPQNGSNVTKSGHIAVKVLETQGKYTSDKFDKKLDKVLHWQMLATGYDKVPVANTFLFDKIEFYWNTRPIMIPKIVIEGYLGAFIQQKDGAGGGVNVDDLVGQIHLELTVTKFNTF